MAKKEPYEKLVAWKEAHNFVLLIYRATKGFPASEKFGMVSQLRRASVSVPSNIVEGYYRESSKGLYRFLTISRSSLAECSYLLRLSRDLSYIKKVEFDKLNKQCRKLGYLLDKFKRSIKARREF